jgi:hypothetical protein
LPPAVSNRHQCLIGSWSGLALVAAPTEGSEGADLLVEKDLGNTRVSLSLVCTSMIHGSNPNPVGLSVSREDILKTEACMQHAGLSSVPPVRLVPEP